MFSAVSDLYFLHCSIFRLTDYTSRQWCMPSCPSPTTSMTSINLDGSCTVIMSRNADPGMLEDCKSPAELYSDAAGP